MHTHHPSSATVSPLARQHCVPMPTLVNAAVFALLLLSAAWMRVVTCVDERRESPVNGESVAVQVQQHRWAAPLKTFQCWGYRWSSHPRLDLQRGNDWPRVPRRERVPVLLPY